MALAVITATPNNKTIRIVSNDGDISGVPCGDTTVLVHQINRQMATNSVELIICNGIKVNIPVGEVEQIGGVTDLDTTMKIRNALITVLNW